MTSARILIPHLDCRIQPDLELRAWALPLRDGALALHYALTGDLSRIRVPTTSFSTRTDGLWRHTCFEAFVAGADDTAYREFNFSPDGQWQAYGFATYREGGPLACVSFPTIDCKTSRGVLELRVHLPPDLLPPGRRFRIGLSAVIEDPNGVLSYWALRHPPGKPDFHHPDTFALAIDLPETPS
jgi:hypothetical protein